MSGLSIARYFPFRRIKIIKQLFNDIASKAVINVVPDRRFKPVCHLCGHKVSSVHSWTQRSIRDLNMNIASTQVWLRCEYRKLFCTNCQRISIEELGIFHPYLRVTKRLAAYIHELCKMMTVTEVARHVQLDWKTVKEIDKQYLEAQYGQPNYDGLRIIAVDEISIKKGHKYLTVVLDYETGRVIYIAKDRKAKTLKRFFNKLSAQQRNSIEAVAMDMWDPYIKAVKKNSQMRALSLISFMLWPLLTG
ncbi:MAG: ISL3 family transposase [Deltaproteobacteria bacterium]|nr:ISL3 family transposase [Deltaproteobacteria bacterium]